MTKSEELRQFLIEHLIYFEASGGTGGTPQHPEFELYARDYLAFAEAELEGNDTRSLINCVGNLKRAMDCQLDTFLFSFGLYKVVNKKNLKFEAKLEFLKKAGVFSSRTLSRLNTIRNKMEHSYVIPEINDLEMYFDLVTSFTSVLERSILLSIDNQSDFDILIGDEPYEDPAMYKAKNTFSIGYDFDKPSINIEWKKETSENQLTADMNNIEEFTYFFKIFFLIGQMRIFASKKYILSQL